MLRWNHLMVVFLLAGCQPVSMYYQPGVTVAKAENDRLDCDVEALREAPVANEVQQTPAVWIPGRQICDASGSCYFREGYYEPGEIYSFDTNGTLRRQVLDRCMARKGYQSVAIPACPQSVVNAAPPRTANARMPTLTQNSCSISYSDGSYQIVNRG